MLESRPEAAAAGGDAMPQQHQRAPCHPCLVFGLSTSRAATLPERTKQSRARVVSVKHVNMYVYDNVNNLGVY
jgi:hypothetical protein